jgi:hypothetical protein
MPWPRCCCRPDRPARSYSPRTAIRRIANTSASAILVIFAPTV